LAIVAPTTKHDFCHDLHDAQDAICTRVVPGCTCAAISQWQIWETFCGDLNIDPLLNHITNPIPFLQVFAHHYWMGNLSTSG